ncbi:MAG: hypothetical protein ABSH50_12845 [Bryobacteraceae bacterium]|jgi:hypothetical protein
MAETLNTRVTRLETLVGALAENQAQLDGVLVLLTEAQIKTEERFQEVARRFQETDERFRQTDARIAGLVSAIGELLRSQKTS